MCNLPIHCRITVRGRIAPYLAGWLGELQLSYRASEEGATVTDLEGIVADQSALQGMLNKIWNLNLTVLSVSTSVLPREGVYLPDKSNGPISDEFPGSTD